MKIKGAAVIAAVAALALSGCGGGTSGSATSAPEETATKSQPVRSAKAKPARATTTTTTKDTVGWTKEDLADTLKQQLPDELPKNSLVSCKKGLPAEVGASTLCTVMAQGDSLDFSVKVKPQGETGAVAPVFEPGKATLGRSTLPPMTVAALLVVAMIGDGVPMDDIPDGDTVTCPALRKQVGASGVCNAPGGRSWRVTVTGVAKAPMPKGSMPSKVSYTALGAPAATPSSTESCGALDSSTPPCDAPPDYEDPDGDVPTECLSWPRPKTATYCPPIPEQ